MNQWSSLPLFPLGAHLCREPMPSMSEMKRDMENLQRHGFNLVKLQEQWGIDEAVEGQYDFSRYEELIAHAATLDMGVYLGLTCEQAPVWLWRKHPDCRMVGREGFPIAQIASTPLPGDGKPGPCYDHPGAMADQVRFISKLVETLGRFENLVVWNTWQEIGYWAQRVVGTRACFCAHTMAHFHHWLATRYGDLDTLNSAWNARYAEWQDILPSRNAKAEGPIPVDMHWQYFMDNVQVAEVLRTRADAIRAADPHKRPIFAHKAGPAIGSGQDWTYARTQDFLGSSCYPAWGAGHAWDDGVQRPFVRETALLAEMWSNIALSYDYIRSANPVDHPVWAAEFQGGPISTGFHKGRVPSPEDIRRWMHTAISTGVMAISFWVTRAEIMGGEQNGFSLLDSTGDTTPRFEEASRIGRTLNAHADLFGQPTLQPAEVGILVNEWSYQCCTTMAQGGEHLSYSTRGWHRLLWDANIPVDFVEVSQLDESTTSQYKALILPFPIFLSEEVAAKLTRYVERGGTLISEAGPGRLSEEGYCARGELSPTMARLCGVQQESFTMVREPDGGSRWSPEERTWGEYLEAASLNGAGLLAGHSLRANVYLETFTCLGSDPVLYHGEAVAGTRHQVGQGQAWLLGTYIGHNGTAYRDTETRACLLSLLAQSNLTPTHSGRLLLRKRVTPDKEAWILTNPTPEAITESFDATGWTQITDSLGEPLSRQGDRLTVTINGLDVRILIAERTHQS